jgi:hypothetical protein
LSGNVNPLFTLIPRPFRAKKSPAVRQGLPLTHASPELAIGILLLARLLLPAILLLLAGLLLPATLLLLTWLLTGGLVLLARIWVLIAHSGSPLLNVARDNPSP